MSFALACCIGCASARAPVGFNVSSEESSYSPTLRIAVALPLTIDRVNNRVLVRIDSAVITAPGARTSDTLPIMENLLLTALVVRHDTTSSAARRPWLAVGRSDSIYFVDALRYGQSRRLADREFTIYVTEELDIQRHWLVFQVTGAALTQDARTQEGVIAPRKRVSGGIRVYACSDWFLNERIDRTRQRQLRRLYTTAC